MVAAAVGHAQAEWMRAVVERQVRIHPRRCKKSTRAEFKERDLILVSIEYAVADKPAMKVRCAGKRYAADVTVVDRRAEPGRAAR